MPIYSCLPVYNRAHSFFQQALPPVLKAEEARQSAACWLLVATQLFWQFNQQPRFFIDESKFPVIDLIGDVMNLDVNGQAIADPESNVTGEISVQIRFAVDGKMQFAVEKQQLEFGMILMPPAMPPALPPAKFIAPE